jgi:hypothetical protein
MGTGACAALHGIHGKHMLVPPGEYFVAGIYNGRGPLGRKPFLLTIHLSGYFFYQHKSVDQVLVHGSATDRKIVHRACGVNTVKGVCGNFHLS